MGAVSSAFSEEELVEYRDLTGFTKGEILHLHSRFLALDPEAVSHDKNGPISKRIIIANLEELDANPFRDRICFAFSTSGDGSLTFDDFVDFASAFGEQADKATKIEWAFRIYDFDGDNQIGKGDLKTMVSHLCGMDSCLEEKDQLKENDCQLIVDKILEEADLDGSGSLSFPEFQLLMTKMPDFLETFRIRF